MTHVRSADGTTIAYERSGDGPAVVLVDGALCYSGSGSSRPLAELLHDRFTVYSYDRRGRGGSTDTAPHSVRREVEDLAAIVEEAGGSASVYGISSGAALAMHAAAAGLPIERLALYEAPFAIDDAARSDQASCRADIRAAVQAGRRGDGVRMFMRLVGVPRFVITLMRLLPVWSKLTAVAHTLPYDLATLLDDAALVPERWSSVSVPTLVLSGGKSPDTLRDAARAVADVLPHAEHDVLPGQTHMVSPKALAPRLAEFFAGAQRIVDVDPAS